MRSRQSEKQAPYQKSLIWILCSCLFIFAIRFLEQHDSVGMGIEYLFYFAGSLTLFWVAHNLKQNGSDSFPVGITLFIATILSSSILIGKCVYETNSLTTLIPTSAREALFLLIAFLGLLSISFAAFSIFFSLLLKANDYLNKRHSSTEPGLGTITPSTLQYTHDFICSNKFTWLVVWLALFLLWMPCYLAYWPGIFSYDILLQSSWVANGNWTAYHPPLHTFLWKICWDSGHLLNVEPIVVYSLGQMLFLSFAFSRIFLFFQKRNVSIFFLVALIVFYGITPVIPIFSFIPTKDATFAGFFVLLLIRICSLGHSQGQSSRNIGYWVALFFLASTCCLLRNNFVYALAIFIIFASFAFKGETRINIAITSLASILVFVVANNAVYPALGIDRGPVQEALNVPVQQIARVIETHREEMDEETLRIVNDYFQPDTIEVAYNPRFGDPIRVNFKKQYINEYGFEPFMKLWLRLGTRYPQEYLEAFLDLNIPYWYVNSASNDPFSKREYIETGIYQSAGDNAYELERESKIKPLLALYESIANASALDGVPLISTVFALSTPFWLMLICLSYYKGRKNPYGMILMVLPLLYWLTFLFGPVSNFRYIFPLFCCYPIFIICVLNSKRIWPIPRKVAEPKSIRARGRNCVYRPSIRVRQKRSLF